MCQYKIVCLKDHFRQMSITYPILPSLLYQMPKSHYDSKQIEHLFVPITYGKEQLLRTISVRDDYSYYHGIHTLTNVFTNEKIVIKMNEYDIEVEENDDHHIIFDILKGFSHNFYMIC